MSLKLGRSQPQDRVHSFSLFSYVSIVDLENFLENQNSYLVLHHFLIIKLRKDFSRKIAKFRRLAVIKAEVFLGQK